MLKLIKIKEKLRLCELELDICKTYLDAYKKTIHSMHEENILTGEQIRELAFRLNRLGCF